MLYIYFSGKSTPRICPTKNSTIPSHLLRARGGFRENYSAQMSNKKQYNPVPSTPRAGGSLLRHDAAFSARNSHVPWPWSIGLGKMFPADGHLAGVSCAGFRKNECGRSTKRRQHTRPMGQCLGQPPFSSGEGFQQKNWP